MRTMKRSVLAAALAISVTACQPAAVTCTLKSTRGDTIGYQFAAAGIDLMAEMAASKNGMVHQHDPLSPPLWVTRQTFAPTGQPIVVATSQVDQRFELVVAINGGRTGAAHMYRDGEAVGAGHCIAY
jgi:hypothetical protein